MKQQRIFPIIERVVIDTGDILKPHFKKKKYRLVNTEEKYIKNKYRQHHKKYQLVVVHL